MKQVQSLILAAILVCTLSMGVKGGDMGSPGIKATTSGETECPDPMATTSESDSLGSTTVASDDLSDSIMSEIWLALLALI